MSQYESEIARYGPFQSIAAVFERLDSEKVTTKESFIVLISLESMGYNIFIKENDSTYRSVDGKLQEVRVRHNLVKWKNQTFQINESDLLLLEDKRQCLVLWINDVKAADAIDTDGGKPSLVGGLFHRHQSQDFSADMSGLINDWIRFVSDPQKSITDVVFGINNVIKSLPDENSVKIFEARLYSSIWNKLVHQTSEPQNIDKFYGCYISFHELNINDYYSLPFNKFSLRDVVFIENVVDLACKEFVKLRESLSFDEKIDILLSTFNILTSKLPQLEIDADNLLNFMLIIINRVKLNNLNEHFHYLQNFNFKQNKDFGILNYAISTLGAVLYYIDNNLDKFKRYTDAIQDSKISEEKLKYRNENGESYLCHCIITKDNDTLRELLFSSEYIKNFPMEDILDDQTIDGSTLLMVAVKCLNTTAASILINIIINNGTPDEIRTYVNSVDENNRNVGHFITNQYYLLCKIGPYLNWNCKDKRTGQTPLFNIFRSYDQSIKSYKKMSRRSFRFAMDSGDFQLKKHIDNSNNTLLHILKTNIQMILPHASLFINSPNSLGMTPLMVFCKYRRLYNIQILLSSKFKDRVSIFETQQVHNAWSNCFSLTNDDQILNLLGKFAIKNYSIFGNCFTHSLKQFLHKSKHGNKNQYSVKITLKFEKKYKTIRFNIKTIKALINMVLTSNSHVSSFLPLYKVFNELNGIASMISTKSKILFINNLNVILDTILFLELVPREGFILEARLKDYLRNQRKIKTVATKSKKLQIEDINMISNFLKFNLNELNAFKNGVKKILRQMNSINLKLFDQRISYMDLLHCPDVVVHLNNPLWNLNYNILISNFQILENSIDNTLHFLKVFQNEKIRKWWKLNNELINLTKLASNSDDDLLRSFFNRKEKLSIEIDDKIRSINELNCDIFVSHELLAVEINNFMKFKPLFITRTLVVWAHRNCL
ncbi:hypothetical protein KAFR_0L00400 [Kazachstania africana CBS 2517]|uniref:VPS9 domain-containing protein n=1 Tax=Kazachstania africana (strain ATCC 22294 / BCRC 22015 / CBS 2517 / CECT 1963 / NBRC 1671 / NRRL Y-8276) TaxID=1071382 RepID=H2B1Z7_KAZAF|nr:hypothetical protein KAFR_0L00400 [Kazachstania africana CBS 2517]CCF60647.1 hypothetical protein KAFR_0L00400 [Kazachstania africana CBS 2517]